MAREARVPVILNPAPALPLDDALLSQITVLTPNEHEASILIGLPVENEFDARMAAKRLRARGPETVIVTLGAKGVLVSAAGVMGLLPAFAVEPVDTTAAGDVFNGALAVALAEKRPLADAIRFAQAAAAISVTRPGAQPSAPSRAEIEAFLETR
jgi:ribokinase